MPRRFSRARRGRIQRVSVVPRTRSNFKRRLRKSVSLAKRNIILNTTGRMFPAGMCTKLKYCEIGRGLTSTAGAVSYELWRLTAPWDPRVAVGGGEPAGWSNYASIYRKYRVLGVKYEITAYVPVDTGVPDTPVIMAVGANTQASAGTATIEGAIANPNYKWGMIRGSFGGQPFKIKGYINLSRLYGISKSAIWQDDYSGLTTGTDTNEPAELQVFARAADVAATTSVQYTITLTYYLHFFECLPLDE